MDWLLAAACAGVAAAFRFPGLAWSPGWDGDEGYNLDIAWHLLHGRGQMFSLSYGFVQHPVLFYAALAPLLALFGKELVVARALAAGATSVAAGVLYLAVAAATGRRAALLGAAAFAAAPFAVTYGRFAYSYNLLLAWSAGTLAGVVLTRAAGGARAERWPLAVAIACAALGPLTDQEGVFLPLFLILALRPRRAALGAGAAALVPALLAAAVAAWAAPADTLADWQHSFARLGAGGAGEGGELAPGIGVAAAVARWFANYLHLLRAEWWWPAAVAGLFCIRPLDARRLALALAGAAALPIFALRELEPSFRTGIPLLLPAAWGLGALLDRGLDASLSLFAPGAPKRHAPGPCPREVRDCRSERREEPAAPAPEAGTTQRIARSGPAVPAWLPHQPIVTGRRRAARWLTHSRADVLTRRLAGAAVAALVVVLPLGLEVGRSAGSLVTGFPTRFDWALARDPAAARRVATFVDAHTTPVDVVLASPHVAWLFRAQTADLFQAAARGGAAVAFYPADLPADRFRFDPAIDRAAYVVTDDYWQVWAGVSPPVARLAGIARSWPLVLADGEYRVYRNPGAAP